MHAVSYMMSHLNFKNLEFQTHLCLLFGSSLTLCGGASIKWLKAAESISGGYCYTVFLKFGLQVRRKGPQSSSSALVYLRISKLPPIRVHSESRTHIVYNAHCNASMLEGMSLLFL